MVKYKTWNMIVSYIQSRDASLLTYCYDPPPLFFTPSGPSPPLGTLALPAPPGPKALPAPQPFQPLPIQPATTPGSPMQVDPANVPLPPMTERTPDDQLWLPSDATALYQLPLVIHTQPPGQQYHSQALGGEPISPERSALHQSLSAMFNVPVPPHAYTRPTSPMDAISESQSCRDKSHRSPSELLRLWTATLRTAGPFPPTIKIGTARLRR